MVVRHQAFIEWMDINKILSIYWHPYNFLQSKKIIHLGGITSVIDMLSLSYELYIEVNVLVGMHRGWLQGTEVLLGVRFH